MRVAEAEFADVAVIVAVVGDWTVVVETVNVPEDWPAGMVIDEGTVPEALDDCRLTITPPAPAGLESVTVPVDG